MAKRPAVGDQAPDFTLSGTDGEFTLSDQRGRRVVLLFYPGDFTPVCTRQFCSYSSRAEEVDDLDAVIGTRRAVVIVDEDGVVRHRHDHALGLDYQSVDDLRSALAELGSARAAA